MISISSIGLIAPKPAGALITNVIGDVVTAGKWIWEQIKTAGEYAWKHGAAVAYKNALTTFSTQIARDLAITVTSGGKGQGPLFQTSTWKGYLDNTVANSAGELLDGLAYGEGVVCVAGPNVDPAKVGQSCSDDYSCGTKEFIESLVYGPPPESVVPIGSCRDTGNSLLKYGLCKPIDLFVNLNIATSIITDPQLKTAPRCDLNDIKQNWENIKNDVDVLISAGSFLNPKQSDLGVAIEFQQIAKERSAADKHAAELERLAGRDSIAIKENISGNIKTPAVITERGLTAGLDLSLFNQSEFTGDPVADAIGVFKNTLASQLLKKLFQQGLVPNPSGRGPSSIFGPVGGIEYAVQVTSSISTPQLVVDKPFDIIGELSNCPSDIKFASVYNCTIDSKMQRLLKQADEGKLLTIEEAIADGSINGGWTFKNIRPSNQRTPDAWYLTDIKKLRLARIVPAGFELAAEKFKDKSVTLKQVVAGFSDSISPYYHLIDPDWVIRAPQSQCRIQGPGQALEPRGGNRQDTCVDLEQCVAENEDGTCQAWGYCTAEQNIWRFGGNSCEFPEGSGYSPYATCQTFKAPKGGAISLLTNSLQNYDDGVCSGAAGCKWYSTVYNPEAGTTVNRYSSELDNRIYLKNLDKVPCTAKDEGCTEFLKIISISVDEVADSKGNNPAEKLVSRVLGEVDTTYTNYASVSSTYLKSAPDYLNCYDVDSFGETITDNDSPDCKKFITWCSADELGCDNFKPVDGSPSVPAVIQPGDTCPTECVGINSYVQGESFFDRFSLDSVFIPTTAKSCPAQSAGCTEFTNIEQPAQGEKKEYYSQLQQCIKDDDDSAKTYYTWVGSDLTGFQLKTWRLESSNPADLSAAPVAGGPCTLTDTPDCKQFYTLSGAIHLRLASEVITASASCSRYRATSVVEADCNVTNGDWDGTSCFYNAIPNEGKKCTAEYNGCREFRGPTANNIKLMFPVSTFGDSDIGSSFTIDTTATGGWDGGVNSNESLVAFGHSYDSGGDGAIQRKLKSQSITLVPAKSYLLTFWAKTYSGAAISEGVVSSTFDLEIKDPITPDWREYKHTFTVDSISNYDVMGVEFTGSPRYVIDNVQFREITDTFFVNKNSWTTPSSCLAPSGDSPYLGCAAYKNKDKNTFTVHSFSRLCRPEAAGCDALIDTQNSSSPREENFTKNKDGTPCDPSVNPSCVIIPEDEIVYRAYDKTKQCASAVKACQRVGEPALNEISVATSWGDKFVKLNPDTYAGSTSPLCDKTEDRCQAFTDTNNQVHYFKDPGKALCEYKQLSAGQGYGWYKNGTNQPCNLIQNESFETIADPGPNLLKNGSFEEFNASGTPVDWTIHSGSWQKASEVVNIPPVTPMSHTKDGVEAVGVHHNLANTGYYLQQKDVKVETGNSYTLRVWTNADSTSAGMQRNLRISGCITGNKWDVANYVQDWEELAITFKATDDACLVQIGVDYNTGRAYFDKAQLTLENDFISWKQNPPPEGVLDRDQTVLLQDDSIAGQYWGAKVLKIKSSDEIYSGVWYDGGDNGLVDIGVSSEPRYFTMSANIFVPKLTQNVDSWFIDIHALPPSKDCDVRAKTGKVACFHGDYIYNDRMISKEDQGKWVYKYVVVKIDPGVRYITLGAWTNPGVEFPANEFVCIDALGKNVCFAGQVAYVDQVSIFESASPYAYSCPSNQSSCTGFRDPDLTDKVYYYLNDNKLDKASCVGKVSEKDGCLLFADLSNSSTNFRAHDTYLLSQSDNNNPKAPVTANTSIGEKGDTNVILKVKRDRVCGEWLSCQSEAIKYDSGGNSTSICYSLGRCDQYGSEGSSKCGNWVDVTNPQPLTIANYITREVNWSDKDLSGYSIPGIYPIDTLKQKNIGTDPNTPDIKLTYIDSGGDDVGVDGNKSNIGKLCRLYPKADAPFPSNLATFKQGGAGVEGAGNIERKIGGYTDANICQPFDAFGNPQNCECSYQQASFTGGENRFYGLFSQPDVSILTDIVASIKSRINRQDYLIGLRGYCLEKDVSRSINGDQDNACLTWMPLDNVSGDISIYDYAPDAGFNNPSVAYYCSEQGAYHQGSNGYAWKYVDYGNDIGLSTFVDNNGLKYGSVVLESTAPPLYKQDIQSITVRMNVWQNGLGSYRCEQSSDLISIADNCYAVSWKDGESCKYNDSTVQKGMCDILKHNNTLMLPATGWSDQVSRGSFCGGNWSDATVKAIFDSNDRLLGFNMSGCDESGGALESINQINIKLKKDYCTQISQVASGIQNKAQTDRLLNSNLAYTINVGGGSYGRTADLSPFGAISGVVDLSNTLIPIYQYTNALRAASPYGCESRSGFDCGVASSQPNVCIDTRTGLSTGPCSTPTDSNKTGCGDGGICMGTRFAVTNTDGVAKVQELFAKVYNLYNLSSTRRGYDSSAGTDISGGGGSVAPEIRTVNFVNGKFEGEGPVGFTILANDGVYTSEEKLNSPTTVSANFYAYNPNGNQMPLAEVRVDWVGDPANSSGSIGKYKNHKAQCDSPLACVGGVDPGKACKSNSDCGGGETCGNNPNYDFGDFSQACVDDSGVGVGYFSYARTLSCLPNNDLRLPACAAGSSEACWNDTENVCVYKPRVHVRDNWDLCFGNSTFANAIINGRQWGIGEKAPCNIYSPATPDVAWLPFNGEVWVKP